jgi:hypothetical protein
MMAQLLRFIKRQILIVEIYESKDEGKKKMNR